MDELRAGTPVITGEVTLVPIERCVIQSEREDIGCWMSALKEPFAIIVCDATRLRAFDMQATAVTVESLIEEVADLGETLAPWSPR